MTTTYKLASLRDIYEQVPIDRITDCLMEISEYIRQMKELESYFGSPIFFDLPVNWIDNGVKDVKISIRNNANNEEVFLFETKQES